MRLAIPSILVFSAGVAVASDSGTAAAILFSAAMVCLVLMRGDR